MDWIGFIFVWFFAMAIGTFASAQILYPIFFALPRLIKLKRENKVYRIPVAPIVVPPLLWLFFTFLAYLLVNAWFPKMVLLFWIIYGVFSLIVLSRINDPKNLEDFNDTYETVMKEDHSSRPRISST